MYRNSIRFALAISCVALWGCQPEEQQLTFTMSVKTADRSPAPGADVPITLAARFIDANGQVTPAQGEVTLTVENNGSLEGADGPVTELKVALDAEGMGSAVFTACSTCASGSKAIVKGVLRSGQHTAQSNVAFTVTDPGSTCQAGAPETVDCSLDSCAGKTCKDGSVSGTCKAGVCTPTAVSDGKYEMLVQYFDRNNAAVDPLRLPLGGAPLRIAVNVIDVEKTPAQIARNVSVQVALSGNAGQLSANAETDSASPLTIATNDRGEAQAYLLPGPQTGNGTITVSIGNLKDARPFDVVRPGTLSFTPGESDTYYRVLGIKGSGWREQVRLRFSLLDPDGNPFLGDAVVKFEAPGVGGAQLSPLETRLDANGEATTTLFAGTQAATIAVKATATVLDARGNPTEVKLQTTSDTLAIVGAKPNGRNFSVRCERYAVPALVGNDCSFMRADYQTVCTAVLGDRFNNTIGRDVRVQWTTEAALFGPPSSTPIADPDADPVGQAMLGRTANSLRTLNAPMPRDVDPVAGEFSRTSSQGDPCVEPGQTRTYNPRDGLNTFIVHTQGEEGFVDENGNGVYDLGERFFDQSEPFVDANDNGVRDADEPFIDVNGNGVFDGPNGVWDGDTTIWTVGHVMFTGAPRPQVSITPPGAIAYGSEAMMTVRWEDEFLNDPAPTYTTYASSLWSGDGSFRQLTPSNYVDYSGSVDLVQVTTCTGGRCLSGTRLAFDRSPQQVGIYEAPAQPSDGGAFRARLEANVQVDAINVQTFADIVGQAPSCDDTSGHADCSLSVCEGRRCTQGGQSGVCRARACDVQTQVSGDVTMRADLLRLDGSAPRVLRSPVDGAPLQYSALVTDRLSGLPVAGVEVTFDVTNGLGLLRPASNPGALGQTRVVVQSGSDGRAVAHFQPGSVPARGQIVAHHGGIRLAQEFAVVQAGTIVFAPREADGFVRVMGVKTSGWREQNVLRFKLLDTAGEPYPADVSFVFDVPQVGGATAIASPMADQNAEAFVTVYSGTGAGTFSVRARVDVGGRILETTSETVAIVGAKPNGRNFSLRCAELALPALVGNDCSFMHADLQTVCTAVIGDRFNNVLGRDVRVGWSTEAALIGPPSFTQLADPDADPVGQATLGRTSNSLRTLNAPMPRDVAPFPGEPSFVLDASHPCATGAGRVANPRDGLNTLIAHTQGEEGFIDDNGNGVYDPGETFFDLGEPFVDANDNNVRDPEEEFIDVNGNGVYDGPNGVWDANTTIWTATHVAFTGEPTAAWLPAGDLPGELPSVPPMSSLAVSVRWQDENGNESAPRFTTYAAYDEPQLDAFTVKQTAPPAEEGAPAAFEDQAGSNVVRLVTTCSGQGVCARETRVSFNQRAQRFTVMDMTPDATPFPVPIYADLVLGEKTYTDSRVVPPPPGPQIADMTPANGPPGTVVTITGANLTGWGSGVEAYLGALPLQKLPSSTPAALRVVIPLDALPQAAPITLVTVLGTATTTGNFTVEPPSP